jgi:creatinine amidohydrolase/Fe(II)-dependent formamide hydrolase-like protein
MHTWIPAHREFAYLTWKQVEAIPKDDALLVLPTAAIEQHGHHLPLATDTLINNLLLGKALAKLPPEAPVYALPPVCYGKSISAFPARCLSPRRPSWLLFATSAQVSPRPVFAGSRSTTRTAATARS